MSRSFNQVRRELRCTAHVDRINFLTIFKRRLIESKDELFDINSNECNQFEKKHEMTSRNILRAKDLFVTEEDFNKLTAGINDMTIIQDHVGSLLLEYETENRISVKRTREPIGRIGSIHGCSPLFTAKSIAMFLKTANAGILKGSTDSQLSNDFIVNIAKESLIESDLPESCIEQFPSDKTELTSALEIEDIDALIATGSTSLHNFVRRHCRVPIIHNTPVITCLYVHSDAEPVQVNRVVQNAKSQDASASSLDVLLIHDEYSSRDSLLEVLSENDVCVVKSTIGSATAGGSIRDLKDNNLLIIFIDSPEEAIEFMNDFSSNHMNTVMCKHSETADSFRDVLQSAIVLHNTSPRFADNEGLGLGPGLGVTSGPFSTGPLGLTDLLRSKQFVSSLGRTRQSDSLMLNPQITFGTRPV